VRPGPDLVRVQKIQSAHIERGIHGDTAATVRESFGELHPTVTMMETSINMRRTDLDEPVGPDQLGGGHENAHGHGSGVAMRAA
jgi:hypothetical protein